MRSIILFAASIFLLAFAAPRPALANGWDTCGAGGGWGRRAPAFGRSSSRGCNHGRSLGYGYGLNRGIGNGRGCSSARWRRYARGRAYACNARLRFVARGQGWTLLRQYVDHIRISPRHVHPGRYWFDRWTCPLANTQARPLFGGLQCPGEDFPHTECEISQAALGLDVEDGPHLDVQALEPDARLALGMERFYRGAFADAAGDFKAVLRADPADARARTGCLMTALMDGNRDAAAEELRRLFELGEVSGRDRLLLEECFTEPERFLVVRDGLAAYSKYHFHQVDPLVLAAWTQAVTGETKTAKRQLKAALRFAPNDPLARHLLDTLEDTPRVPTPERDAYDTPGNTEIARRR